QQSARYFSPHERNNVSPTTGNLTVLNSTQCYPPPNENLLHRPSCLTCPTIGDHCDHPTASTIPPHPSHFHPFHHNAHGSINHPMADGGNKNLMTNQHPTYDSCHNFDRTSIGRRRNDSLEESANNLPDYFNECVKKESITPPNIIKSNNINNNNNNNVIHKNNNNNNNNEVERSPSILQLKTEPIGNPDSPESSSIDPQQPTTTPDDCAGCGRLIQDRFYLSAIDKKWHSGCLQCCICENALDGQTSLFCREGNIYCKSDYYR
ncbi:CLUMA_CG021298, isoform A, partial [Clunio marinus]